MVLMLNRKLEIPLPPMEFFSRVGNGTLSHFRRNLLRYLTAAFSICAIAPLVEEDIGDTTSLGRVRQLHDCLALKDRAHFENTTILDAQYFEHPVNSAPTLGVCLPSATIRVPLCRVQFAINTSTSSVVTAEAWLPTTWHGRFLALGNGGLSGCINYLDLEYGTSMHFATVASNNGHDGNTAAFFFNKPEVHVDFSHRAVHIETMVGKQIVEAFYGRPHDKSYYLGCSTGGRQGVDSALRYPDDFDGIIAGAPATDYINVLSHAAMMTRFLGGPNASRADNDRFLSPGAWDVVADEILRQCDGLDGVEDGIITEPDDCHFRPESLLCKDGERCLTVAQVESLRNIYSPVFGSKGQLLASRFDPGAEEYRELRSIIFSDEIFQYLMDYWKYVIYNDTSRDMRNFNLDDIEFAGSLNPAGIATTGGDMSKFRSLGGKLLMFHGRRDPIIASGNTKRLYDRISRAMGLASLDSFLRLFFVPGMDHCLEGPGASDFGQGMQAVVQVNDSDHNILLALVDWVETGKAPESIVGTNPESGLEREHCRYPLRSIYNGSRFKCAEKAAV